jgi:hypothetical protein
VRACARESMRVREHARVSAPLHLGTATQVQPQGYGGGRVSERASKCVSERASTECDSSTCCWFGEPTDSGGISGHSGESDGRAVPSSHVRVSARCAMGRERRGGEGNGAGNGVASAGLRLHSVGRHWRKRHTARRHCVMASGLGRARYEAASSVSIGRILPPLSTPRCPIVL